jgi:penicillin-binding protein 1A
MFDDEPLTIDGWSPRNFSRKYQGKISMADALANSINTVAVRIAEAAGRGRVVATARRLGITSDLKPTPSLALGSSSLTLIEMTAAYGAFANGGNGVWAYGIKEIRDGDRNLLYTRRGSGPGRVMSGNHAALINKMLAKAIRDGTGKAAVLARPVAGKTGTSQNFRDAWFVGYSADLIAGVWMGNDNSEPMNGVTGGGLPARAWRDFMEAAHGQTPTRAFPAARPGDGQKTGLKSKGGFLDGLLDLFR